MLVDEVIVERSQNLTVKDLRGMKGGILGKGNKVNGRKALLSGEKGRKLERESRLQVEDQREMSSARGATLAKRGALNDKISNW